MVETAEFRRAEESFGREDHSETAEDNVQGFREMDSAREIGGIWAILLKARRVSRHLTRAGRARNMVGLQPQVGISINRRHGKNHGARAGFGRRHKWTAT